MGRRRTLPQCYRMSRTVDPMDQPHLRSHRGPTTRRRRLVAGGGVTGGPRRRRLLVAFPAVIGLALAAAACGGGGPKAGVASVGATTTTTAARAGAVATAGSPPGGALVEYARCMRSHGVVNFPEPGSLEAPGAIRSFKGQVAQSVASLASSPRFQAAQRACAQYAPQTTSSPPVSPQEMQKLLAVSRCMRAHGVPDFPDPNPVTGDMNPPPGISRNSPIVLAALRACTPLARAAGLGPPNTGQ
jgi:hypothetical protein